MTTADTASTSMDDIRKWYGVGSPKPPTQTTWSLGDTHVRRLSQVATGSHSFYDLAPGSDISIYPQGRRIASHNRESIVNVTNAGGNGAIRPGSIGIQYYQLPYMPTAAEEDNGSFAFSDPWGKHLEMSLGGNRASWCSVVATTLFYYDGPMNLQLKFDYNFFKSSSKHKLQMVFVEYGSNWFSHDASVDKAFDFSVFVPSYDLNVRSYTTQSASDQSRPYKLINFEHVLQSDVNSSDRSTSRIANFTVSEVGTL